MGPGKFTAGRRIQICANLGPRSSARILAQSAGCRTLGSNVPCCDLSLQRNLKHALLIYIQLYFTTTYISRVACSLRAHISAQSRKMTKKILLINGPNLNLLGTRQPELYGSTTLQDVESRGKEQAANLGAELETFQSNHEGAIVDRIHSARHQVDAIVINPAAFTHTSVAIRDALLGVDIPFIEIHITNTHARETFRHHSYLSDKAEAVLMGLGTFGYTAAIEHAIRNVKSRK